MATSRWTFAGAGSPINTNPVAGTHAPWGNATAPDSTVTANAAGTLHDGLYTTLRAASFPSVTMASGYTAEWRCSTTGTGYSMRLGTVYANSALDGSMTIEPAFGVVNVYHVDNAGTQSSVSSPGSFVLPDGVMHTYRVEWSPTNGGEIRFFRDGTQQGATQGFTRIPRNTAATGQLWLVGNPAGGGGNASNPIRLEYYQFADAAVTVSAPTLSNINASTNGNARSITAIATSTAALTAATASYPGVTAITPTISGPLENFYPTTDLNSASWLIDGGSKVASGIDDPFGGTAATRINLTNVGVFKFGSAVSVAITDTIVSFYVRAVPGGATHIWQNANDEDGNYTYIKSALTPAWQRISATVDTLFNGVLYGGLQAFGDLGLDPQCVGQLDVAFPQVNQDTLKAFVPTSGTVTSGTKYRLTGTFTGLAAGSYDPGIITATNGGGTSSPGVLPGFTIGALGGGGEPGEGPPDPPPGGSQGVLAWLRRRRRR